MPKYGDRDVMAREGTLRTDLGYSEWDEEADSAGRFWLVLGIHATSRLAKGAGQTGRASI